MSADELTGGAGRLALFQRRLRLPVAMRDAKVFLKLLQLELAAHPPGAPVIKAWISAEPAPPRSAQRGLFLPITPEAEKAGDNAGAHSRRGGRAAGGDRAPAGYAPARRLCHRTLHGCRGSQAGNHLPHCRTSRSNLAGATDISSRLAATGANQRRKAGQIGRHGTSQGLSSTRRQSCVVGWTVALVGRLVGRKW